MLIRQKRASKWMLTAAAGVAVTMLAGCGSTAAPVDKSKADGWSQEYAGTELFVLGEATLNSQILESMLPDFEEKTGIRVKFEQAPYDQVVQKSVLNYSTGRGDYDVISIPYEYLGGFVEQGYLLPIDKLLSSNEGDFGKGFDSSDILPELWKASAEWDGTSYGFPSNSAITMMVYRKDLFEDATEKAAFKAKYGYELAPATTFDQYRDIAEFFNRPAGAQAAGVALEDPLYGVAMAGKRHIATVLEWMNYSWAFGGDIFDKDGMPAINSAQNVESLEFMNELGQFAPTGFTTSTWDEVTSQLQQGMAAQSITWGDTAGSLEDTEQSTVAGKIGYANIPVGTEGNQNYGHLGSWTYTINADSKNQDASMLFLAWALSQPVQEKLATEGGLPALQSVFESPSLTESLPYWTQELQSLSGARSRPRIAQWGALSDALALDLSRVFVGDLDAQAALDEAQSQAEALLKGAVPVTKF